MPFLQTIDYKKRVKDEVLTAIINNDITIREDAELSAIEEMTTYLSSRYNTRDAFLDYDDFNPLFMYLSGTKAVVNGKTVVKAIVSITPGPFNASEWQVVHERSALLVTRCIDIVMYTLCRLNPRQIPELYKDRYNQAIDWLKMVAEGNLSANLPLAEPAIQDNLESTIKYGSKGSFRANSSNYF